MLLNHLQTNTPKVALGGSPRKTPLIPELACWRERGNLSRHECVQGERMWRLFAGKVMACAVGIMFSWAFSSRIIQLISHIYRITRPLWAYSIGGPNCRSLLGIQIVTIAVMVDA